MAAARFGLFSVLLTLLWWMPYAEANTADGYHLEQTVVDAAFAAERSLSIDEPDQVTGPSLSNHFTLFTYYSVPEHQCSPCILFETPQQARAPPQRLCI